MEKKAATTRPMTLTRRTAVLVVLVAALLAACGGTTSTTTVRAGTVRTAGRWVILPVLNNSETPQAGERLEAMLDTILRKGGVVSLDRYPAPKDEETHLASTDRQRYQAALEWARTAKFDYAVGGSVEEWRYKSGLDAEPAIGMSLRVLELSTGKVVWASTGTRTGESSQNTSATAVQLLDSMVRELIKP